MLESDNSLPIGRTVPATLASQTYERLRRDIVDAHYAPGQKLGTRQLSERYDVGLAPLREALTRLSREGLVIQHDRRGFFDRRRRHGAALDLLLIAARRLRFGLSARCGRLRIATARRCRRARAFKAAGRVVATVMKVVGFSGSKVAPSSG